MFATAVSPDGRIRARIGESGQVELSFDPGAYRRYDERALSHQLERLGQLGWVAYDRAQTEELRVALGRGRAEFAEDLRRPKDERRQRYDAELAAVEAAGVSPSGRLRIGARGMLRWRLEIERGALSALTEREFLAELGAALRALLTDRETQIALIKARHYDLGIPRAWRDLVIDPGRNTGR